MSSSSTSCSRRSTKRPHPRELARPRLRRLPPLPPHNPPPPPPDNLSPPRPRALLRLLSPRPPLLPGKAVGTASAFLRRRSERPPSGGPTSRRCAARDVAA